MHVHVWPWSMCWWIMRAVCSTSTSDLNIETTNVDEVVTGEGQGDDSATPKETSGEIESSSISKGVSVTEYICTMHVIISICKILGCHCGIKSAVYFVHACIIKNS